MADKPKPTTQELISNVLRGTGSYNVFTAEAKDREEKTATCPHCGAAIRPGDYKSHCRTKQYDGKHPKV